MKLFKKFLYLFCTTCQPNTSRTVRYAFPIVATALAILGALAISSTNQSYIRVESTQSTIAAGKPFSINVYVSAHKPINAVDIALKFPKSQIQITGIDTGESVITLWTEQPFVKNDTVIMRGGTFRKGFLGEHLIATINAVAVDTGVAYFNVTQSMLLAGDGSGSEIKATKTGGESAKLYIADKQGVYLADDAGSGAGTIEGVIEIRIFTDVDGDGKVTLNDISRFMSAWTSKSVIFDFSGDGKMTFTDFAIILADSFFK